MKKLFTYFGVLLSVALMCCISACVKEKGGESANLGLGIKVFSPTKVVAGSSVSITGSGFTDATEVVFPDNVVVTNFQIVSDGMIRVKVPAGVSPEGGNIIVRTAADQAESRLPLTIGNPVISGYSKQPGESIQGGELLSIYGKDLEFLTSVELLDADGNPVVIPDSQFYRKGTSTVIIIVPKKVFDGTFAGKVNTLNGKTFDMPELAYEPASEGGHLEIVKVSIWKNPDPDGNGAVNWNGTYRFALEGHDGKSEAIAEIPADVWEKMKTQVFYMQAQGSDWVQMRIVTGWWNFQWPAAKDEDITPNFQGERIIDNGDGTYYIELDLNGTDLAANMDTEHLLFTGSGYTPLELYFEEEVWVGEAPGPQEVVIWENDDPEGHGAVNWNGTYRFALEGHDGKSEAIAEIPADVWEKMKTQVFYMQAQGSDWVQMRIVTGWWNFQWPAAKDEDITPNFQGERIIDNGDGTYYIELDLNGTDLAANMDTEHLLFTGSGYTPLKLYFIE